MSLAEVRQSIPEFLREVFDAQLPAILDRISELETSCRELRSGRPEVALKALKTAHDLGGSLGAFGIMDLSHRAQSIEAKLKNSGDLGVSEQSGIMLEISDIQSILHP